MTALTYNFPDFSQSLTVSPPQIKYREGYKYQLFESYSIDIYLPDHEIITPFIILHKSGILEILAGYAWDGASGIAIDTNDFMRGSLVHDALYQLIREFGLSRELRAIADDLLRKICLEDGMPWVRAKWVYDAVRIFGSKYTLPNEDASYIVAP